MVAFVLPLNNVEISDIGKRKATLTEGELINGLKLGERFAIDYLYKMYSGSLYGIITRIVKFDEIAEDVLQDTFLKIWKSITHYDASKGRLFTWMANLAKNTAIDQVRSKNYVNTAKTDDITDLPIDNPGNNNQTSFNPETIGMKQLISKLKADQKEILDLVYFKGYTQAEVAEHLEIPLGTVKTKIRLSIIYLRKYFNEL